MDYFERSSVWKTHRFLAASCRITKTSGLEYILTRKCPLPYHHPALHLAALPKAGCPTIGTEAGLAGVTV